MDSSPLETALMMVTAAVVGSGTTAESVRSHQATRGATYGRHTFSAAADLSTMDDQWRDEVDQLTDAWHTSVVPKQRKDLLKQIRAAVNTGDLASLADLTCIDAGGKALLATSMVTMADNGAAAVVAEAHDQDVHISKHGPDPGRVDTHALVTTRLLNGALAASAAREALRLAGPGVSATDVVNAVAEHLESLSQAGPQAAFGAALTVAQNAGRNATLEHAPPAEYYASEKLDTNTCKPCKQEDGKLLGTTVAATYEDYPTGGYRDCLGRDRCRGLVVAVWPKDD